MGKLINLNGDADKNKTLQKILEQLDTLKDELAELLSESEDTDTDLSLIHISVLCGKRQPGRRSL